MNPRKSSGLSLLANTVPLHQWPPWVFYVPLKAAAGRDNCSGRDLKVPLGDNPGCVSVCRLPEDAIKKHPFNRFAARLQLIKQLQVMKGWSCSADNSFAAPRAWQASSKTSLCLLGLAPHVLQLSIFSRSLGESSQPWGFVPCMAQSPCSCRRDRLGSWPSAEALPL